MGSEMTYGSYSFTPVPLFTWATETIYDSKLDRTFLRHSLDFTGTLLAPAAESGQLPVLLNMREDLQESLALENKEWVVRYDGVTVISGIYPRVGNVTFDQGVWVDRIDYSFTFEYDEDFFNKKVQSFTETWSFEESEDRRTVTANHDISAVGINTNPSGVNNAFVNAKTFVLARTGYTNVVANTPAFVQVSGVSYGAYEELRSEQVDVQGGAYSVSENYVLSSGTFIHTQTGQVSQDEAGITTVSLDGTIRGLGRGDHGFARALTGWRNTIKPKLPAMASGVYTELEGTATLFTSNFQSYSVTRNPFNGSISYTVSYNDSPTENLPSGVLEFAFNVQDQKPVRLFASFPIMERALGNVVQDIGTSTEGQFTISGNAQGKPDFPYNDLLNFVETKINANRPQLVDYQTLRLSSRQITRDVDNRTVNFSYTWTYTVHLSQIPGATDDIVIV